MRRFDESLHIGGDPIGALTTLLPTWIHSSLRWFAILGLIGGIVMDIYSSGLSLLATKVCPSHAHRHRH